MQVHAKQIQKKYIGTERLFQYDESMILHKIRKGASRTAADPFLSYSVSIGVRVKQIFMVCDVTLFHG